MKKKVILDVDTGVDDALGILLAVRSGNMDVLGITTVNGNVSLDQATKNTCKILQLLGMEEKIPVVKGADKPLMRASHFEHHVHGNDGLGGALSDMPVHMQTTAGHASDFIVNQVREHVGEVTLVMTAPLTNLALAVMKHPDLIHQVKEVIVMGGVVQGFGNITPTAEYNMYVDPEAAKIVFQAGFPSLTLVGLDVTRKALLTDEHIRELGDSPIARYVQESTANYMKRYYERNGVRACALHDPLAVGVALNKQLVTTRHYYVDVETRSELCDGQTVCDFQNRLSKEANVHVCMDVSADEFLQLFINALRA
ncbi:nucleoside hydrolase [Paenibacillus alginolyticus]|uniref:nucleoside hydrolase n=1 Tax=Paenibacillus alginolyticus TaxID=59839 RepID=UPI0004173CAC|nr:nucleoside hydrolase [Paenibacillus alginolyticus]MCY9668648.1 nucleoside hydrolase [Paenibacillus alginolyticus]